jgi:D-alanyl-D-alanine carboxypeptidase
MPDLVALHQQLGIPSDYASRHGFLPQPEADLASLVLISGVGAVPEIRLTQPAAAAWVHLRDAAANEGYTLLPLSGFRSVARQAEIIRKKTAAGQPMSAILAVNAAPGFSEHHTGCAVDVGTLGNAPFEEAFGETPEFRWLIDRARSFGFTLTYPRNNPHGIAYEPWHWRWNPDPL